MAVPQRKRRKLEHTTSNEESDAASFASFSSDDEGSNERLVEEVDGDAQDDMSLDGTDEGGDATGSSDDENDGEEVEKAPMVTTQTAGGKPTTNGSRNNRPSTAARGLQTGAYTSGTFKSSMFKLQVDELLEQIRPRHGKRETEAESALHRIKSAIQRIPDREPLLVLDAEKRLMTESKIATPFPQPPPPQDAKYKLSYARPENINVIGSYALKTGSRASKTLTIDMTVTMPSSIFQEKDYLDYRYFYKRAYYLACVAAGLKTAGLNEFDYCYACAHDNPLKALIEVKPKADDSAPRWKINVIPCTSEGTLDADKLRLNRSNVRHSTTNGATSETEATPFYNSSIRSDMLVSSYLKVLHNSTKNYVAFVDASLLGSTWLRQRGLGSDISAGGFGSFEWSALLALLLQGGGPGGRPILSDRYSSYQLFKAALQAVTTRDLSKQPIVVGTDAASPARSDSGLPVVWDALRKHNILYKMTPWSYRSLRSEARATLQMLSDNNFDGFDACFITRVDNPLYKYDHVTELNEATIHDAKSMPDHSILLADERLYKTLRQGLGDRVNQIALVSQTLKAWDSTSSPAQPLQPRRTIIGLAVNPETVERTIDHGPSAEQKTQAAAFRKFWGQKPELRRFKDGSIMETLVWDAKAAGMPVLEQVVRYLLKTHFGEEAEHSAKFVTSPFDRMISRDTARACFSVVMDGFKQLETDIRSLADMPLSLRQLSPADPQLRYASVEIPGRPQQRARPADVVLQFEGSARWPDDLVATQRTKIAFLLKLSEQMQESNEAVSARIGLENEDHDVLNQAFLDATYESGATFRLRIHHDREQTLLERRLKDKTTAPSVRDAAVLGLAMYKRDYLKAPAHTQAFAGLCSRHPALSGTVRLMKKWFAAHLLHNHIADEVVELIVSRTFVQPWPWPVPSSAQTGFYRTLHWLAKWDWRNEPLIVDLSGGSDLKQPQYQSITTKFEAWRKLDPALNRVVLFAASNVDLDGTTWTDGRPAKVVAGRMTALAKAARTEIEAKQLDLDPSSLFYSPLGDFDFVLHLNAQLAGARGKRRGSTNGGPAFKNLELDLVQDTSMTGFAPVKDFADELARLYGAAVLLFSGGEERPVIAGLWNPQSTQRAWTLNLAYSTAPVKPAADNEKAQAQLNKQAILAEIVQLGSGLVERVEVHDHKK